MSTRPLRYLLLGFGASTVVASFLVRLHPTHFWLGVACVIAWNAWTSIVSVASPPPSPPRGER